MAVLIGVMVGLILGSFLSVLLGRWPHWHGAWTGRSHCPNCMHLLAWYDLVPLISWVLLRGRCRYCRAPISVFYPVLELTVAATLGLYAFHFGVSAAWNVADLVALFGLLSLFFFDLKYQILPDAIVAPLGVVALFRVIAFKPELLAGSLTVGVLLAAFFGLLHVVSHGRWVGFGDVKLALVVGILFGVPAAVGVTLLAIWAGAATGLALMVTRRAGMRTALPFGSFWSLVAIVTMLWPAPAVYLGTLFIPSLR